MGKRYLYGALLTLILFTAAACSGGGSKSTSTVTLKFGTNGSATAAKTVFAGSTTATAAGGIPSIVKKVVITVTAADMSTITRTIAIATGQTAVTDSFTVANGTGRTFTVEAFDNYGNKPYAGSTVSDLNGTNVSLTIGMVEDVNQAITAKLYQYFKDTIEAKGTALTPADMDPFYAQSFGIHNGMSRKATIDYDVKDYAYGGVLTKGMVSLTVTSTPLSATLGSPVKVTGKGYFKDGSYGFPDGGFLMIKENGEWKITGNNYRSAVEMRGITTQWLGLPTGVRVESGFMVRVEDRGNTGLVSAVVKGPGLPTSGIVLAQDTMFPQQMRLGNAYWAIPQLPTKQWEMYVIDDATLGSIASNSVYTFSIYDSSNVVVETRTITMPTRPWLRSEVTAAYFPALSGLSPVSAATNGHYLADARLGSTLAYGVAVPTAFKASWFETSLDYYGWDSLGKAGYYFQRDLLLNDTSASFSSALPVLAIGGNLTVTAEDFDNRREIETTWLFYGPPSPMQISSVIPFMTSNFQDPTGVTAPAGGTVWKFGTAPPTITWGGSLLTTSGVEIFLLADDPGKLAIPAGFGDPFPGSMWVKLTPTVVPASTGALTLSAPVEALGIVGSGCRIMVVSTSGDVWALSAPFTISP
ncbi:hypothetical protein [Geotalea sp. SG265]|uniref:hypothetical protein n=1 Tax=Geotalea sp. SG265 TaxID=2922867 RepID=UPI001FAF9298|nr:hypothetical protein [Geotalea sp. SG265]